MAWPIVTAIAVPIAYFFAMFTTLVPAQSIPGPGLLWLVAPGVRIVPTPGHVPGHQSFVIDTTEGRIVIAGQAYQDAASYARDLYAWQLDREGHPHPDYAPWVARLQEFDPWRVTFAHDLAIWQREA